MTDIFYFEVMAKIYSFSYRDASYVTPMEIAVAHGNTEIVRILLEGDVSANMTNYTQVK